MSSPLIPRGRGACQAFTLIELLTVIAIIGILSAITLGVVRGVRERGAISKAKSELAVLASALEAFKRQFGDYPQTGVASAALNAASVSSSDSERQLFNALVGKLGPKVNAAIDGRSFIDLSKFSLLSSATADLPAETGNTAVNNALVDPWGRLYQYAYRANSLVAGAAASGDWRSYVIFSAGPDGVSGISINATTGAITVSDQAAAADNIYANP